EAHRAGDGAVAGTQARRGLPARRLARGDVAEAEVEGATVPPGSDRRNGSIGQLQPRRAGGGAVGGPEAVAPPHRAEKAREDEGAVAVRRRLDTPVVVGVEGAGDALRQRAGSGG